MLCTKPHLSVEISLVVAEPPRLVLDWSAMWSRTTRNSDAATFLSCRRCAGDAVGLSEAVCVTFVALRQFM